MESVMRATIFPTVHSLALLSAVAFLGACTTMRPPAPLPEQMLTNEDLELMAKQAVESFLADHTPSS